MKNVICFLLFITTVPVLSLQAGNYTLLSPDKNIQLEIRYENELTMDITGFGNKLVSAATVGITIDGKELLKEAKVSRTSNKSYSQTFHPVVKIKSAVVNENYNELTLVFNKQFSMIFRAYNEGVAYRFVTDRKGELIVNSEQLDLNFPTHTTSYLMKEPGFRSMSESPYVYSPVDKIEKESLYSTPGLFAIPGAGFVLVSESDLEDYPGLWLQEKNNRLSAVFPQKVLKTQTGSCTSEQLVEERADYLAKTKGKRAYPWRAFVITPTEKELVTNQLIYLLGKPAEQRDFSWIKPGLATLDWWGRRNIYGADFKGGVNTETHKYFVDFNHKYGLTYFVLDDGWSHSCDLRNVNKELDLDELKVYAAEKGVDLVFWVHAFALKQDVPGYLDFMKSKGAKGIKVDFFVRDDQDAINLIHEIARESMIREMVVDFHGICKPFGLNRTYPNILTSEGLIEFEMNGVTDWANPYHHTLLPFIRMVTGPMDYLPGTFNNAQKGEFYMCGNRPVGLGSRSHAMALNVLYESPLTMLPDSPADYYREHDCMTFLSGIPVVWDETRVLDAKIGEYVILARRSGDDWFVGAITNWDERECTLIFDFLGEGNYTVDCFTDGPNTNTRAIDYQRKSYQVARGSTLQINLAQGGGWIGKISSPQQNKN